MADEKLVSLTELTTPTGADKTYVVDVSDTTDSPEGTSKQMRLDAYTNPEGIARYDTVADLPVTGVVTTSYKVTADPTPANNGFYTWGGASYTQDSGLYGGAIESGETDAVDGDAIYNVTSSEAIQMLRLNNPDLIFSGFVDTTTSTPGFTINKAYIASVTAGFGVPILGIVGIVAGDIIVDTGYSFVVVSSYANLDFSNAKNLVQNFNFDTEDENYAITGISGAAAFVTDKNIVGTTVNKWTASAGSSQYFIRVKTDNTIVATEVYKAKLLIKSSATTDLSIKIQCLDSTGVGVSTGSDVTLQIPSTDYFLTPELEITVPALGYYFRVIIYNIANTVEVSTAAVYIWEDASNVNEYLPSTHRAVTQNFYVDQATGADTNTGNYQAPFATINAAIQKIAKVNPTGVVSKDEINTKIIIAAGDYRESLTLNVLKNINIELVAKTDEIVRIMGSDEITTFSKTATYTNIYESEFSGTLQVYNNVLAEGDSTRFVTFEDGRDSKPITTAEINGLQNGKSNRLPYSVLINELFVSDLSTTLTNLDANPGYFYHDTGTNKYYVHATDSDNPSSNGYNYEYALRVGIVEGTDYTVNLKMSGITFIYSDAEGVNVTGINRAETNNLKIYGSRTTGYGHEGCKVFSSNDEVGGSFFDGVGADSGATIISFGSFNHLWVHDCGDNAVSYHELGELRIDNSLLEYCGDGGAYPSFGSYAVISNTISRKNHEWSGAGGYGFGMVGASAGGRTHGAMTLINCISTDNNYGVGNFNDNVVSCYNVVSHNNTITDYNSTSTDETILVNCKGATKGGTGTITITTVADIV